MGRKRKQPVELHNRVGTEVPPQDGLPPFRRFLDVFFAGRLGLELTRVFFTSSRQDEVDDFMAIRASGQYSMTCCIGTKTPIFSGNVVTPLFDYSRELGLCERFSTDLVRLVIHYYQGRQENRYCVYARIEAIKGFVDSLKAGRPATLTDIRREHWEAWIDKKEKEFPTRRSAKAQVNRTRAIFKSYAPTAMDEWLAQIRFGVGIGRMLDEHTSELAEANAGYSDKVMYQILAYCLEGFQRRIGYLKRYESVSPDDMPKDWVWPGRKAVETRKGVPYKALRRSDVTQLLVNWLSSEDSHPIIINQILLDHKSGLIQRWRDGSYRGGTLSRMRELYKKPDINPLVRAYWEVMAGTHGYPLGSSIGLLSHYLKRTQQGEPNLAMDQIGWCLGNLIMMQAGVNREVVLSVPSRTKDGKSILDRADTLFPSSAGATECELYGIKARTGASERKTISVVIARNSPLFQMLRDYERYVKVDFDGPFLELSQSFVSGWSLAGIGASVAKESSFSARYPIFDDDDNILPSIEIRRFRKVFASAKLLEHVQGIKDMSELAERMREDLNHGRLDTTITHYLLKSATSRSVIDIAVATITSEKLREGLNFRGKIVVSANTHAKKYVFLCECADPAKPSHDLPIADECKYYDLCLGCERSVVTSFHLPYICKRILQYEEARCRDTTIWGALYENHWMIAHDALDRYIDADKKNGQRLVGEAWAAAREGRVSLPPITNTPSI